MASNSEAESRQIQRLVDEKRWDELRQAFSRFDPADVADILEDMDGEDRDAVFEILDLETASGVLTELDSPYVEDVVEDLSSDRLADLAERMAPDEAAELLGDLEDEQSAEVLAAMEPKERADVSGLLRFPEDSAGRIMTPEILRVAPGTRVAEVKRMLRESDLSDPVHYVYVVDPATQRLLGVTSLQYLLLSDESALVDGIVEREYAFASADQDQEDVARMFLKYNLWVMPVVDEAHRLVGRITADDVLEVLLEEADEDLAHMVGAPDIDEEEEAPHRIARLRLPWLCITMVVGFLNSIVISTMLGVTKVVAIAIFVPAILAMGGNTGMQASAVAIRGIALGRRAYGRLFRIVWREIRVGFLLGLVCGSCTVAAVLAILVLSHADTGGYPPWMLALTVGGAMANAMTFASAFGSLVPIVLHRLNVDPALASGPFVTTSTDLSASLIYFLSCAVVLRGVSG